MVREKSQDSELLDSGRPEWTFDPELQRELDRGEFAGEGKTIEGEIAGTGEWTSGKPIPLRIAIPLIVSDSTEENNVFTEEMDVPEADEPLSATKFGRILKAHGYSRGSAHHLTGDTIKCSYDGEWTTVDPNPPNQNKSVSTNKSPEKAKITKNTKTSSAQQSSRNPHLLNAKKNFRQGISITIVSIAAWILLKAFAPQSGLIADFYSVTILLAKGLVVLSIVSVLLSFILISIYKS